MIFVLLVLSGFLLLLSRGGHCQRTQWSEQSTLLGAAPLGATHEPQHYSCTSALQSLHWVHNEAQEMGLLFKSQSAEVKWHELELKKDKVVLQGRQKTHFPTGRGEIVDFTASAHNFIAT